MLKEKDENSGWRNSTKKYLYLDKFEKHQSEDSKWKSSAQKKIEINIKYAAMAIALSSLGIIISILAMIKVTI